MAKVSNIDDAKIDSEVFKAYTSEILGHMREAHNLKEQAKEAAQLAKEAIDTYAATSKIPVKELKAYMDAKFAESLPQDDDEKVVGTQLTINRGSLFEVLNSHLDISKENA